MSQLEKIHAMGKVNREKEFRNGVILVAGLDAILLVIYFVPQQFSLFEISYVRLIITSLILIFLGGKIFNGFKKFLEEKNDKTLTQDIRTLGLILPFVYCSTFLFASFLLIYFR